jgi:hypothetical protein
MQCKISQVVILAILLLTTSGPSLSQEIDARTERALHLVSEMGQYIGSQKSFSFRTHATFDEMLSGQTVDYSQTTDVYVSRPHGVRTNTSGDLSQGSVFYDGSAVAAYDEKSNFFAAAKFSGSLHQLTDFAAAQLGLVLPAADFLQDDPAKALLNDVQTIFYVGRHPVDGIDCHHIAAKTNTGIEWQLWIEDGIPLPRKIAIKDSKAPIPRRSVAEFTDWNVSADLPESLFRFTPPHDAVEIEFKTQKKGQ